MACIGAGIGEAARRSIVDEPPVVTARVERHLEHAEGRPVPDLAVRLNADEPVVVLPAGAGDELANSPRIRGGRWVLRREPLVDMVVAVQNHIRTHGVQVTPEDIVGAVAAVLAAREPRVMPKRECASSRMRSKIGLQPLLLSRPGPTASHLRAIRVQRDDVPGPDVEAVIALPTRAGGRPEVVEIPARATRGIEVLVISDSWTDERLRATPGRVEHLQVLRERVVVVLVVAECQNAGQPGVEEEVRRLRLVAARRALRVPRV